MQLRLADRAEESFGSGNPHKAISAGLVVLLHLVILIALLHARAKTHDISEAPETILTLFPLLRHEQPAQAPPSGTRSAPKTKPQTLPIPTNRYQNISPPVQAAPDATVLGPALNGCDLENMGRLSPEQRARCIAYQNDVVGAARIAKDHDGLNKPTRAVAATDWAQAIVKRNTPVKVDCATINTEAVGALGGQIVTTAMLDLRCAARHLANHESPLN